MVFVSVCAIRDLEQIRARFAACCSTVDCSATDALSTQGLGLKLYSAGVGASGNNLFPLGPPSCSTGIGVAGTDARVISTITGHLVALTGIGAAPVTPPVRLLKQAAPRQSKSLSRGIGCLTGTLEDYGLRLETSCSVG